MNLEEEIRIINSIRGGNLNDFSLLYDAYIEKIYRYVYFRTRQKETAEDVTSDVFLKALSKIQTFDASKASFSVWIYRIARNTVIDFYRTRKETSNIEDAWDLASPENVPGRAEASLSLREVEEYIKKLKPEQRELVVLRVWQDLSYKEIAEITGKNENNLKVAFSRIMSGMRKDLGPHALAILIMSQAIK